MDANELRALADALCVRHYDLATVDVIRAADYLRAQADAQPVAWSDGLGSFIAADERVGDDPDILAYRVPLYTHPAPAVPQAEPDDDDALVLGEPDMLTPEDVRRLVPQAEPKREALSDDEILDIATAAGLRFSMYSDDVETRAAIKRLARAIEREHGIGGSDAE